MPVSEVVKVILLTLNVDANAKPCVFRAPAVILALLLLAQHARLLASAPYFSANLDAYNKLF